MPGLFRPKIDWDTYKIPEVPTPAEESDFSLSSESDTEVRTEDDEDSVIQAMKDRRRTSGQEIADMKLRSKITGKPLEVAKKTAQKSFMEQFPYKSCQRKLSGTQKRLQFASEKRKKLAEAKAKRESTESMEKEDPEETLDGILSPSKTQLKQRRLALKPSPKSEAEVRYVATKVALTGLAAVKMKKMHPR